MISRLLCLALLCAAMTAFTSCIANVNDDIGLDMSDYQDQVGTVRNYNYEIVDFYFKWEHYNSASPDSCDPGETFYMNVKIQNVSMLSAKENNYIHFSTDEPCVTIDRNYHEWGWLVSMAHPDYATRGSYWRDFKYDYASFTFLDLDKEIPYVTFSAACAPDQVITFNVDIYDAPDCYETDIASCETTRLLEAESFQIQLGVDYN